MSAVAETASGLERVPCLAEYVDAHLKLFAQNPNLNGGSKTLKHRSLAHLAHEHGEVFTPTPWKTWRGRGYRMGRLRHCYSNSFQHLWRDEGLTYVEGLAFAGLAPAQHAWLVDTEGRVVDPTWRDREAFSRDKWEYYGIPFTREFVWKVLDEKGTYGMLDYEPFYRDGVPEEAIADWRNP